MFDLKELVDITDMWKSFEFEVIYTKTRATIF